MPIDPWATDSVGDVAVDILPIGSCSRSGHNSFIRFVIIGILGVVAFALSATPKLQTTKPEKQN